MNILSDKTVKTRKQTFCDACGRKFPAGTKMHKQVNTLDGIQTWTECPTCQELLAKHRSFFADDYNICYEFCVNESLKKGMTPEDLLLQLNQTKNV